MRGLLLCMSLILVVGIASAQDNRVLVPDTPFLVDVVASAPQAVLFDGNAGDVVTIASQTEDDLNPVLWLVSPSGVWLAYDDDANLPNAVLGQILLLEDGRYTVYVDSFNGVSEGQVTVSLTIEAWFSIEPSDDGWLVAIRENQRVGLPIELEADESVTITVSDQSGTLDPYIRLVDGAGDVLAINDDHQSGDLSLDVLDAQISGLVVSEAGTYTLEIVDFLGRAGTAQVTIRKNDITRP